MIAIEEIIEGCKKGCEKHQSLLYKVYAGKMFALCLYYSKNRSDAEDLLQDGFIKVFNSITQVKDISLFDYWIRKVFVNCALARYRKMNLVHFEIDLPEPDNNLHYENIIDTLSAQEITQLIQSLSPQYQIVFNLYAIEGYSHKDIAEMLHISENTSKSNLSRARAIMQDKVSKHQNFERLAHSFVK